MIGRYHKLRRIVSAGLLVLLVGIPFLRIRGESVFRFDVPTLRLLLFGTDVWIADFFPVLIALIFLTFFILFVTTLFGRIWCGWLCPQTVLLDTAGLIEPKPSAGRAVRFAAVAGIALICAVIAGSLVAYFVDPYEVPSLIRAGGTAAAIVQVSWAALAVLLFLDARLLGRKFCATVCPYAKMQGVLFDDRTLQVAFDGGRKQECMGCEACVRSCPVQIDIRQGLQVACIHCAECIDACSARMKPRGKKSLIGYSRGIPGNTISGLRINPLITGVLSALSLIFLLYLSTTRMPFDMSARLVYPGTGTGAQVQTGTVYDLSFRNMTGKDLTLELTANAGQSVAVMEPQTVIVHAGSDLTRITASVRVSGAAPETITLTARSREDGKEITKNLHYLKSDEK